jgi:hypothetical protein
LFFSAVRSFTSVSRVCVNDANCPCSLSFMRTSGNMSFDKYSASARASCGSVFFTDWYKGRSNNRPRAAA